MSVLPVRWGSTRPTESPALPSPRLSSWPWRGSSGRSSTCPSPSGPSSPPPWPWRRPRWRSGSRIAGQKPRGSRRPSWRNSKWPPTPRRRQSQQPPPEVYTLALRYRCRWAPCHSMGKHTLPISTTTDPYCPFHLSVCMLLLWATACTTYHKKWKYHWLWWNVSQRIPKNGHRGHVANIKKTKKNNSVFIINLMHKEWLNFTSTSSHIKNLFFPTARI